MTDQNRPRPSNPQQPPVQGMRRPAQNQRSVQGQGPVPPQGARRPMNPSNGPQAGQQRPMNRPMNRPVSGPQTRMVNPQMRQGGMPQRGPINQIQQNYTEPTYQQQSVPTRTPPTQPQQNSPLAGVNQKALGVMVVAALIFGIIIGAMLFSSSSTPAPQGLLGVVKNDDIRVKLPRCGRIDKGQACILYIMNSTRYDQIAESFFEEALRLTEVPIYSISMANPKYAKRRIPPGHFAEIHIPKVR